MILTIILALILAFFFLLYYIQPSEHLKKHADALPCPPALPIVGHALRFGSGSEILKNISDDIKKYGKDGIILFWSGPLPCMFVYTAEKVEALLNSSKNITKSIEYEFLQPWLGEGLLTSGGDKWRSRRKLLTPAFHFKILSDFVLVFWEQTEIFINKLDSYVGKGPFDIFPMTTYCTLDIICETAMGQNVNAQDKQDSDYVKALHTVSELIQDRQISPWKWNDFIYKHLPSGRAFKRALAVMHGFTERIIKERTEEFESNLKNNPVENDPENVGRRRRLAFLDLLLQTSRDGANFSDLDIREEVDTFMFEGHDTTAAAISWTIHLIGCNPEIQRKLQEEVDEVWGSGDRIEMEDLKDLKYLECAIKEGLRLFPSVPIFNRIVDEDYEVDGWKIPAGIQAGPVVTALHRDPKVFPDPEKFDPDRFLLENSVGRHPFAYIPFSAGPRNCIGQRFAMLEEKVILASMLKHFTFKSHQTREELKPLSAVILRPKDGIIMSIERREL